MINEDVTPFARHDEVATANHVIPSGAKRGRGISLSLAFAAMCCIGPTAPVGCGPGLGARLDKAFAESVEFYRSSKAFASVTEVLDSARPFWEDEGGHGFLVAKLMSSNTEEAVTALLQLAVLYDVYAQVWGDTVEAREKHGKRFDLSYYLRREKELLPLAQGDFRKWLEINQECGFGRGRKR